jgi:hypothetical protein
MQIDPSTLQIGDIIRMRRPDGSEVEGRFGGSLKDLLTDNGKAPVVRTEVMEGVTLIQQGALRRFEGAGVNNLGFGAMSVLLQASEAGAAAADYLKGYMAAEDNPYADPNHGELSFGSFIETPRGATEGDAAADGDVAAEGEAEPDLVDQFKALVNERIRLGYDVKLGDDAEHDGTDNDDMVEARDRATINGYKGDDAVSVYDDGKVTGGEGHDRIDGYSNLAASGDDGNDIINGYDHANLAGGKGDDRLTSYGSSTLQGGEGNDHLAAYGDSVLDGGEGHDYLSAYSNATLSGGAGNDFISAYDRAQVDAGDGRDFISVGDKSNVVGGAGDDIIRAGAYANVSGGAGNDSIRVRDNATIRFGRGDGVDTIAGEFMALPGGTQIHTLASATIELGAGIGAEDVVVTRTEGDLRIAIAGSDDVLTVRGVDTGGAPSLRFADGSTLDGAALLDRAIDMPPGGIVV